MEEVGVHGCGLLALLVLAEAEVAEGFEEKGGDEEVLSVLLDLMGGVRVEELSELFVELAVFRGLLLAESAEGSTLFGGGFVVHPSFLWDY